MSNQSQNQSNSGGQAAAAAKAADDKAKSANGTSDGALGKAADEVKVVYHPDVASGVGHADI